MLYAHAALTTLDTNRCFQAPTLFLNFSRIQIRIPISENEFKPGNSGFDFSSTPNPRSPTAHGFEHLIIRTPISKDEFKVQITRKFICRKFRQKQKSKIANRYRSTINSHLTPARVWLSHALTFHSHSPFRARIAKEASVKRRPLKGGQFRIPASPLL